MEQLNLDKLKYLIFCEAHEPLKVRRKIEIKRKKYRDEIVKFARGIQKYVETYRIAHIESKLLKSGINSVLDSSKVERKDKNHGDQKMLSRIKEFSDEQFISSVLESIDKKNSFIINLRKGSDERYFFEELPMPSKR